MSINVSVAFRLGSGLQSASFVLRNLYFQPLPIVWLKLVVKIRWLVKIDLSSNFDRLLSRTGLAYCNKIYHRFTFTLLSNRYIDVIFEAAYKFYCTRFLTGGGGGVKRNDD